MSLKQKLLGIDKGFPARFEEQKDSSLVLEFTVAERKVPFISKKKLIYRCRLRVDDEKKTVTFFETLKEKGFGLVSTVGDMEPGYGFKKETYKISGKEREANIEELSTLFGKQYKYSFDYSAIRAAVKKEVQGAGYSFSVCLLERSV